MSNYNWCHNPNCHTYQTQSRVRGTGDNKVLRTRKFATEIANRYPVNKPSETPIKVQTEKYESHRYRWNGDEHTREPYQATRKIIRGINE